MNFKTTYILFGVLAVLLGVLAVVLVTGPTADPGEKYVFRNMHDRANPVNPDDITRVVIERKNPADANLVFERGDDREWKITEPRSVPADSAQITSLVSQIREARIDEENKPASRAQAGLDEPTRIIRLFGKDREFTLTIGRTTKGEENALTYVLSSDRGSTPLAVSKSALDAAREDLNYFRNKNLLGTDTSDITAVRVSDGKRSVELAREDDRWKMVQPAYGYVDVNDFLPKISDLRVHHKDDKESDFVKDGATDLAQYGLDAGKGNVLRIEVTRGKGEKARKTALLVGLGKKLDKENKYYAALDQGNKTRDVVKVSADLVKPFTDLLDDPEKLRSKALVQIEGFKQIDAVDVVNGYGTLSFRRPDASKPWELYRNGTGNPVDESEVKKLIDELNRKDIVTGFVDPKRKKELGLEKTDTIVKVYAESLEKPNEKKDDKKEKTSGKPAFKKDAKPVAELRFGNRERDQVAVERIWGSDTAIVLVPQGLLDQVRKGPLAYLDRAIPPFNTAFTAEKDVTKVEVTRGGETFEITRDSEKDPWKFTRPPALKGRQANANAVRDILDELNRLRAEEIVAEKPDQKEMTAYELASPPVRVAVTLTKDKKPTTHTFNLGKEVPGKGVYLKQGERDMVYLVGPSVLQAVRKELRDTSLFDFDAEKVTAMTVKGWYDTIPGVGFTLSLEQKDGKWTVKSPAGFNLDPGKAGDLVRDVSRLQAERFVPSGKGLKLAEGALEITLELPEKKTRTLTVGASDAANYFATTDQLKGEVVLIPKGSFDDIKKGPNYFARK